MNWWEWYRRANFSSAPVTWSRTRGESVVDFGIDGQIEATDHDGKPTGQLFAVQVKAGRSRFREEGEKVIRQMLGEEPESDVESEEEVEE